MAQWSTRRNQVIFCCFRCVIEQWALTVIKLLRFFVLIFAVFLPDFIFFVPQWHSHPSFIKIVDVLLSLHPIKPERSLCGYSSNDQYQGNGFAAEVLLGRDHPRVVPIRPIVP